MKVQTTGTAESLHLLESVLKNSGGKIIHNGEFGRDYMTNINVKRNSFARVWHIKVNDEFIKLRFWYENRDGSMLKGFGNITGSPRHFEVLGQVPEFKTVLQKIADSVNVPIQEDKNAVA